MLMADNQLAEPVRNNLNSQTKALIDAYK